MIKLLEIDETENWERKTTSENSVGIQLVGQRKIESRNHATS